VWAKPLKLRNSEKARRKSVRVDGLPVGDHDPVGVPVGDHDPVGVPVGDHDPVGVPVDVAHPVGVPVPISVPVSVPVNEQNRDQNVQDVSVRSVLAVRN